MGVAGAVINSGTIDNSGGKIAGSVALLIKRRNFPWNGTVRLKLDGPSLSA